MSYFHLERRPMLIAKVAEQGRPGKLSLDPPREF
jgi:hypothetical protein